TGGVGEHDAATRAACLAGLERIGIAVDPVLNAAGAAGERAVSVPGAEVPVLVIPTDEEWEIAHQTFARLRSG
ncbi:acetate kinase, partial [Nonomuraea sp. NPDC001023]